MIYFDNSSTTPVCEEARQAALAAMSEGFGNPGSLHGAGVKARLTVENARAELARALGCSPAEIYFSHSGTLADNTAVFGAARAKRKQGGTVITSAVEHPAVARCADALEAAGTRVIRLTPGEDGKISPAQLAEALDESVTLVSIMTVNNETGAVNDIKKLAALTKRTAPGALFHTDAIQAFGKLPLSAASLGADLITVSGHKLHAPKGAGALYVRKGVRIKPFVLGGGQEEGMFSGTESVPAIAGFGAAVRALGNPGANLQKVARVRDIIADGVRETEGCVVNSPDDALPYVLNFSAVGIPSQVMINFLSERGIYVSAGSACKRGHRSEVLTALGLPPERIDSAIRVSLSRFSTEDEAQSFISALREARKTIRTKL